MSETKKTTKQERNFEMELMEEKLKALEAKVVKPMNSQEAFQARVAQYDANKDKRDALKATIEANRRELREKYPEATGDEIRTLEAFQRRSEETKSLDPRASNRFKKEFNLRVKQLSQRN